jgi:hypothetical protein
MYDYLGCTLLYETEKDVTNKLTKILLIMVIISQVLKPPKSRSKPDYKYTTQSQYSPYYVAVKLGR